MTASIAAHLDAGDANGPGVLLSEHHRETEAACTALLARTYADDPHELVAQFRAFEREMLEHLTLEEELILPAYAIHAPADAQLLRQEHVEIRRAIDRLGLEVELHVVRASSIDDLVDMLRAHAAREEAGMYPWAQVHLSLHERRQLFVRLGHSLRTLARGRHLREA